MARKKVVILGSTGSIGVNTLKVIERYPGRFEVVGLTAYSNLTLLEKQIRQFSPNYVGISSRNFLNLKKRLNGKRIKIVDSNKKWIDNSGYLIIKNARLEEKI